MRKQRAFSLIEVLVASMVFSLVIVGLTSVFIAGGKHMIHARERVTSAQLSKFFIDPLQASVRQDTWNSNSLNLSATAVAFGTQIVNNRTFTGSYITTAVPGTDLRRVVATITWTE